MKFLRKRSYVRIVRLFCETCKLLGTATFLRGFLLLSCTSRVLISVFAIHNHRIYSVHTTIIHFTTRARSRHKAVRRRRRVPKYTTHKQYHESEAICCAPLARAHTTFHIIKRGYSPTLRRERTNHPKLRSLEGSPARPCVAYELRRDEMHNSSGGIASK